MNFELHVSFALEAAYLLHQAKTATKPPREKRKLDHIIMTYWSMLGFKRTKPTSLERFSSHCFCVVDEFPKTTQKKRHPRIVKIVLQYEIERFSMM